MNKGSRNQACWATWRNQNDFPAWAVLQLLHPLPKMATNGKAYGSRSYHGRPIVSLSILGDLSPVMKVETVVEPGGNKQAHLALVPPEAYCLEKLTGGIILSALFSCVTLDSLCAMTFSRLECVGLVTCFLENQVRILHRRAQRGPDFIPLLPSYRQPLLSCL